MAQQSFSLTLHEPYTSKNYLHYQFICRNRNIVLLFHKMCVLVEEVQYVLGTAVSGLTSDNSEALNLAISIILHG